MGKKAEAPGQISARLLDEVEQLRTSLESALEENARLMEDRDRLSRRVTQLSQDLQAARSAPPPAPPALPSVEQGQAEEELRVAFEELQVLTEELEVANSSLQQANHELDGRVEERTRQIQEINDTLRATENSPRTIADLVPDLLWRSDATGHANWFNQRWCDYTGWDKEELKEEGWTNALHPLDRASSLAAWAQAMAAGTVYQEQHRIRDAQGDYRWFLIRAEPMRDANGTILAWFAAATDMHEQRTAMEALQRSELRFRTLIEGMPQLVWRAVDSGQWTWSSPQWSAFTGQSEKASRSLGWLEMLHPDDRDHAMAAWTRAQQTGSLEIEGRIFNAQDRRYRHFRTRGVPVRSSESSLLEWLGTSTDVDDIVQLQAHQEVLVGELQHRTRNLMAVVQSVTARTLKGSHSLDHFAQCIGDRFDALARVQGLLSRRKGGLRVTFDALLREELSAHVPLDADGRGEHVTLTGPAGISLKSATVQTLALALHELATNAVKYGALSQPAGRLEVRWDIRRPAPGECRLFVDWRERGVSELPAPGAEPKGGGYGRELIERALPYQLNAQTSYAVETDGVHCTIDVRVPSEDSEGGGR